MHKFKVLVGAKVFKRVRVLADKPKKPHKKDRRARDDQTPKDVWEFEPARIGQRAREE